MFEGVPKWYKRFAVLLLNFIVLSFALNLLAWPALVALYPRPSEPPFSPEQLRETYGDMSVTEIRRLLAETWRERPWRLA